ncbi:intradiol ring-cleavage dioxygenase [Sphingomonas sp.]|uniref:intradiol ring-cleavage dioxygenase n=1 Tax=Sphingomonas sp. TaxID=28214 RepID=UPI0035C7FBD5
MHIDDHDHGLAHDLKAMEALVARRRALKWFAGAGTAALVASCGSDDTSGGSLTVVDAATPTPTPSASATPTPTPTAGATCVADPQETAGPYPGDGTNNASGATSNVLTSSGIVRSDIRASFIGSTTVATGVAVKLTLTLVDVNSACAPLAGYAIYLWQCDREGRYSLYTAATESYLRGVQVTDANGQVSFTTIFPGCYDGRWPHMHFEVFTSLTNATSGRYAVLTSQLAMPSAVCATVFADTATYPSSAGNFARVSLGSDMVFADNGSAQIAQMTPTFTGSVADGYAASAVVGLAT